MTSAQTPGTAFRHVPSLDGLRAVAVLIVMLAHAGLDSFIPGGFGVTIFFFLSGYLITSLLRNELQRSGGIDFKAFYVRRTLRIIPPLVVTLTLTVLVVEAGLLDLRLNFFDVLRQYLFLANYSYYFNPDLAEAPIPLWSLAVEEHFYLLFPIAYLTLARRWGRQAFVGICAALCLITLIVRIATMKAGAVPFYEVYMPTHTRMDSLLFGVILALWNNPAMDGPKAWRANVWLFLLAGALILFCLVYRDLFFRETFRYTIQGIALFLAFSYVISHDNLVTRALTLRPMRITAELSYTLYLCHMPIFMTVEQWAPGLGKLQQGVIGFAAAYAYAALSLKFVERPAGQLRHALLKPESPAHRDGPQPMTQA